MMKISKSSHKLHKSSRGSPLRKDMLKKPLHSSSMRISTTSRSAQMKHLSSGMKRIPVMAPSKSVLSPRMRSTTSSPQRSVTRHSMQASPVHMERVHSLKRSKFEKRKLSPSPGPRRPIPSTSLGLRGHSPYDERYLNSKSSVHGDDFSPPPLKKKLRREPDRYEHGDDMSHLQRSDDSMPLDSRISHRSEMSTHSNSMSTLSHPGHHRGHVSSTVHVDERGHFDMHDRGHGVSHPKRLPPVKSPYDSQGSERYRSTSPGNRYASTSEKRYGPTLHERFSTVVESNRAEPKIKYSQEDLKKITIDIHRNLKAPSPTLRRIVDPSDVKLVRRANEGHRPMFDREEIKQAPRDMRDDAYYEKKATSGGGIYNSARSLDVREVENYEITRHRFDPHHATFHASSGRSLSDRWQNPEAGKEGIILDRDDREREYIRQPIKKHYIESRRSKSRDRDFRSERYSGGETSRGRSDYPSSPHHMLSPRTEHRSFSMHHKESIYPDARKKLNMKREIDPSLTSHSDARSRYLPLSEKRYSDSSLSRVEKHHGEHRSSGIEPSHKWPAKRRSPSREEKFSEFSRRPEKYAYKSWSDRQDIPSRSSDYYQSDGPEVSGSYRGRGSSRPYRSSRGSRSRGFRGGFPTRSSFRGGYRNSSNLRGRGGPRSMF